MKQQLFFFICVCFLSLSCSGKTPQNCSEEKMPLKLTLKNADWNEINTFDQEQYAEQVKRIGATGVVRLNPINPDRHVLMAVSEILWNDPKAKENDTQEKAVLNSKLDLKQVFFDEDFIPFGYKKRFPHSEQIFLSDGTLVMNIQVDPTQFEEQINIESRTSMATGHSIRTMLKSFDNTDDAKSLILERIMQGNMEILDYLSLYRIDHGPGDTCLVGTVGDRFGGVNRLSDDRVVFVRGNVAVYLESGYKDFGCMDLAYRFDEFLVEQIKKQQGKEKTDK